MNLIDDPRLTAYALNEMTDVADRAAFERELANDPLAQAEVDALRATAGTVRAGLLDELRAVAATQGGTPRVALQFVAPAIPADADLTPTTFRRTIAQHWKVAAAAAFIAGGVVTAAMVSNATGNRILAKAGEVPGAANQQNASQVVEAESRFDPTLFMRAKTQPVAAKVDAQVVMPSVDSSNAPQSEKPALIPANQTSQGQTVRLQQTLRATPSGVRQSPHPASSNDPALAKRVQPIEVAAAVPKRFGDDSTRPPTNDGAKQPSGVQSDRFADVAGGERDPNLPDGNAAGGAQGVMQKYNFSDGQIATESSGGIGGPNMATASIADDSRAIRAAIRTDKALTDQLHAKRQQLLQSMNAAVVDQQNAAESYAPIHDNPFLAPTAAPLSTFGVDVDTASFANVRRYLTSNQLPPADAVRIEELVNYFPTSDAPPTDGKPFAVYTEVGECPWSPGHRLVRIGLKGQVIENEKRPASNLVFLVDVSGSMDEPNKLPLVQRSLRKLVGQLGENDRVAIVVYAGNSGMVLPSTNAGDKTKILDAIDNLKAGGSTNGGEGIELAYKTATQSFVKGGTNRVILCTDGDFNVGVVDRGALFDLIASKAKDGVFLSVCGFGTGNTKDDTMEGLADKGNGQYAYIDTDREADKVFVGQIGGTLVTIAKDVKLQIEFNPATVKSYRLIGYENRVMAAQDFNNDLKDSGDIGAGHNVTALYEIEPTGGRQDRLTDPANSELKYQKPVEKVVVKSGANTDELLTLKLRFKKPDAPLEQGTSELIETVVKDNPTALNDTSADFRFDASVAAFGMMLRESPYKASCSWELVRSLASGGVGSDAGGYRSEFINLIDQVSRLRR